MLIVICAGAAIVFTVFTTSRQMDANLAKVGRYAEVARKISALDTLKVDYLIRAGERVQEQWQAVYESLGGALEELQPQDADERQRIESLATAYRDVELIFAQLAAGDASGREQGADAEFKLRWQSLLNQKLSAMFGDASRLAEESQQKIVASQRRTGMVSIVAVIAMLLLSGASLVATHRKITRSIQKLYRGTRQIAEGNLQQHVEIDGADEVAKLAEAFNGMARKLSDDIADRRGAEDEVRRLNRNLEQRVADRTAELERSNKELEAFAYSVSHDLRAPLRHIQGFVTALAKRNGTVQDEESRHYLSAIAEAASRMTALIDDLLGFSRLGSGQIKRRWVALGPLVRDVIGDFAAETQDRAVEWQVAELPDVSGDRALLRIALVNLISNALKFTRQRTPARIEIGSLPGQDSETVVYVRDNGAGFDMQYADRLFGVFQRLHGVEEFEGTGIGLANVRRIIHRHGGRTWAEGEVDKGAVFYFSLPPEGVEGRA